MENIDVKEETLCEPKIRSRKNSLQPIDRHINDIDFGKSIYINAGIDSTCGLKRNTNMDILNNENISSENHLQ